VFTGIVISYHAPPPNHTNQYINDFWDEFEEQVLKARVPNRKVILMGDANAQLGSNVSNAVINHHTQDEDLAGERLHSLALQLDLVIPSTFATHYGEGDGTTLASNRGDTKRVDYIAVPSSWTNRALIAETVPDFDLGNTVQDHVPAVLYATPDNDEGFELKVHRGTKYCIKKMAQPAQADMFKTRLKALPPARGDDLRSTWIATAQLIQEASTDFFPLELRPIQPYINEETWKVICVRRPLRKKYFQTKQGIQHELLRTVLFA
jgi:hypothetical protein